MAGDASPATASLKVELGGRLILEPPAGFNRLLRRLGGQTINGLPNFRLVWGWSRLDWFGGVEWAASDVMIPCHACRGTGFIGNGEDARECVRCNGQGGNLDNYLEICPTTRVPKYWPYLDRWYLEMWNPPESYGTPQRWWRDTRQYVPDYSGHRVVGPPLLPGTPIDCLGPYPDGGDYETVVSFHQYPGVALPYYVLEHTLDFVRQARSMTGGYRRAKKRAAAIAEEQKQRAAHDAAMDAAWDRLVPAFGGDPFVAMPGAKTYNPATKKEM